MNSFSTDISQEEILLIYTPEQLEQLRFRQLKPTLSNENTIFYYEDKQGIKTIFKEVLRDTMVGFFIGLTEDGRTLRIHCLKLKVKGPK